MAGRNPSKLDDLTNSYKELSSVNEKQEKRVRFLETRAMHLICAYCLYQVIVFFGISKPSDVSCHNWWMPFCLSLLMAIIAGLMFTDTITKLSRTQYAYECSSVELEMMHYQMFLFHNNQMKNMDEYQQQPKHGLKPDAFKVYQWYAYFYVVSLCLFAFTVVILHANWSITCGR